jgi:WD40 repeat protein
VGHVCTNSGPSAKLSISDCGGYLAVGAGDGSVCILSASSLQILARHAVHDLPVTGLSFAGGNSINASDGSEQKTMHKTQEQHPPKKSELLFSCSADSTVGVSSCGSLSVSPLPLFLAACLLLIFLGIRFALKI